MRWIMLAIVVVFVLSLLAGFGGFSSLGGGGSDPTVAKINGEKVKLSEIERVLVQEIEKMDANMQQGITSDDYPILRGVILDQLALTKELEKEVATRKIAVTKEEIEIEFKRLIDQFPTKELFMEQLKSAGLTEAKVKEDIKRQLSFNKLLEVVVADASVDVATLQSFYETNKTQYFKVQEGYRLNIASFKDKAVATTFRSGLSAKGANWDELIAGISSEDLIGATSRDEPLLIPVEQMVGPTAIIKKTPVDSITPVIKVGESDFLVVMQRGHENERIAGFDEVSQDINEMLIRQEKSKKQSAFMEELRQRSKIEKVDEAYFKVNVPSEDIPEESAVSEDK